MNQTDTPQTALQDGEASRLLDDFAVSQAAGFARQGAYDRAESLLRAMVQRSDSPAAALDLQARVCAQQGRLGEAACWWQKVLDKEPTNAAAQAALARLDRMQRRPVWVQVTWPLLVGAGTVAGILLLFVWQGQRQTRANAVLQDRVAEVAKAEGRATQGRLGELMAEIQAVKVTQARSEGNLAKVADFSGRIDGWRAVQQTLVEQLKGLQVETKRIGAEQAGIALSTSNQVDLLRRNVDQGLASTKDGLETQMKLVREEGERLAARQAMETVAVSNQVAALRLAIDREKALVSEIERRQAANEKLQSDYRALTTRHEQLLIETGLAAKPPSLNLAVPGVTTSVAGKEITVSFDDGLFDHGTHFKAGARDRLLAVGKALAASADTLEVKALGYADDDRAFLKWTARWEAELAMERASAVVGTFIEVGLLKPQKLLGVAGDSQKRPFASDSMQSRMRNRTVVLKVTVDRQN